MGANVHGENQKEKGEGKEEGREGKKGKLRQSPAATGREEGAGHEDGTGLDWTGLVQGRGNSYVYIYNINPLPLLLRINQSTPPSLHIFLPSSA